MKVNLSPFSTLIISVLLLGTLSSTSTTVNAQTNKQVNKAIGDEVKGNIEAIIRAQQAYYIEYAKFAETLEQLAFGLRPELTNHDYRLIPQGDLTQEIMMSIPAKHSGLRSYSGAVFIVKKRGESLIVGGVCETDKPSLKPPAMPIIPRDGSTEIQCPVGSHVLAR
jgi:hypothetical protein